MLEGKNRVTPPGARLPGVGRGEPGRWCVKAIVGRNDELSSLSAARTIVRRRPFQRHAKGNTARRRYLASDDSALAILSMSFRADLMAVSTY
jgi:hypothetical protein